MVDVQPKGYAAFILFPHLKMIPPREGLGYLLDKNVFSAVDTLFHFRRKEILKRVGLALETPGHSEENAVLGKMVLTDNPRDGPQKQCVVWSISFYRLHSLALNWKSHQFCDKSGCNYDAQLANELVGYYVPLANLVSHIDTKFFLKGPEGCSAGQLHELLRDAAHVLVIDDIGAKSVIHKWFEEHLKASRFAQSQLKRGNPLIKKLSTDGRTWGGGVADSIPLKCAASSLKATSGQN